MESATESLRRLLDERGVEWWNETDPEPQSITMVRADERLIEYHENANGSTGYHIYNMHDLTPEQAIAATLGWGKLTADDVRDLIEWHSDASGGNGRIFHNGAYVEIADELNATLGRETCHITERNGSWYCDACDNEVGDSDPTSELFIDGNAVELWEFCPRCGRKVVDE